MKFRLVVALMLMSFASFGQSNLNIELVANVEVGEAGNDIWGFVDSNGLEYAIMGSSTATRIFSLEDPTNPNPRAVISGATSIWRDIKHYDNYLYVTTDEGNDGLLIIDMTNAPEVIEHRFWTPALDAGSGADILARCHNLYIDAEEGWCYLAGCNIGQRGVLILDIHTDPLNPIHVGSTNEFYSHDVVQLGDKMYSSEIQDGHFSVYDISDKTNPQRTILQNTSSNFTHNAWPSDDGAFLFTTDEMPNSFVDAYDISDPSDVKFVDSFQPLETAGSGVIPHNTHYDDGYLVTSWYTDGLVIVDANKPDNLIKVGAYDTWLGGDGGFRGCWGAYPYLPSGLILASDINSGLYVFSSSVNRACYLEGNVVDSETGLAINMARVEIQADQTAFGNSNAAGVFKTGLATAGSYSVTATHPDYLPGQVNVELENGVVTNLTIELEKLPSFNFVGNVVRSTNGNPIEGANIIAVSNTREIEATSLADGSFEITLFEEDYTFFAAAWGYNEIELSNFNPTTDSALILELEEGYKDDFFLDQGWTVTSGAELGNWERAIPIGTNGAGQQLAPGADSPDDEFGEYAYVTGNGGGNGGANDVDNGTTILTSPPMDLSNLSSPIIYFSYWFTNTGGLGDPVDDALVVRLSDGANNVEVASFNENLPQWINTSIDPSQFFDDLSNISIGFQTSDTDDTPHLVEAGIDKFFVLDGLSNTQELVELEVKINPNPFTQVITIESFENEVNQFVIRDALGREVLKGTISQGIQEVNTSSLSEGVYYIQLNGKEITGSSQKIIKI